MDNRDNIAKTNSAVGRSWEEVRKELFTPEEIAESNLRVAIIGKKIKANDVNDFREECATMNNNAIDGDALEFIDSFLTPEEIAESNRRVAIIGKKSKLKR